MTEAGAYTCTGCRDNPGDACSDSARWSNCGNCHRSTIRTRPVSACGGMMFLARRLVAVT